ncbi:MAG: hypothetical protein AAB019_06345, partial [Planctomycetota bacterium]
MNNSRKQPVNGILLLYHHPLLDNAPTIMDHVNAFSRYSRFKVWNVNTELGFPGGLRRFQFQIIILHYSLCSYPFYQLNADFMNYLGECSSSYKIAFYQDEFRYCRQRFDFINQNNINCVYTLLEPDYFKEVYRKYTNVSKLVYTLPGYFNDHLLKNAERLEKSYDEREIDIGYRGRQLPFYCGKGGQEKHEIGVLFRQKAAGLDLKIDIETDEYKRIYGSSWYRFLSNCRAVLGVEAGVSIFDLEDKVRLECENILRKKPRTSFPELSKIILNQRENNIYYRTISPRHFESAVFRVSQILFEGKYSGIMRPMVHYLPLKKDFSNFDEVVKQFKNKSLWREITENAYNDLIASGRYSY